MVLQAKVLTAQGGGDVGFIDLNMVEVSSREQTNDEILNSDLQVDAAEALVLQ